MRVTMSTQVSEQGSAIFIIGFEDEEDQPVTPVSITWKLTDSLGNVVNDRSAVSVTPATEIAIVLEGDDLALSVGFSGDAEKRYVTIYGTYNSSYGSGLPYKHEFNFPIANLVAIS